MRTGAGYETYLYSGKPKPAVSNYLWFTVRADLKVDGLVSGAANRCGGHHPALCGPQPSQAATTPRGLPPRPDIPPGTYLPHLLDPTNYLFL